MWHADAAADVGGFDCEIVELEQDRRIVWRWGFVGPQRDTDPRYDSLLTVTLDDTPAGGTALTLVHERLDELAAALPQVADNVRGGWESALDKLAEVAA
ncbi:SRPBCC domain-containing protein [Micromonospora sp. NPDC050686]|uniref:SRPBCC family protein n=1 Tax=Micromonospora sp. NPDC050686 TaxID=3154631 RepID=UPI0033DE71B3